MAKKLNSSTQQVSAGFADGTFSFTNPHLEKYNSGWVIEWDESDPENPGKMKRKRSKLTRERKRYATETEFMKYVAFRIRELKQELKDKQFGIESMVLKRKPLVECLGLFLKDKDRNTRPDTIRVYHSQVRMLIEWLKEVRKDRIQCSGFTDDMARSYLNRVYNEKEVSNKTYNNYLTCLSGVFSWMIENKYCEENPFSGIKKKERKPKKRTVIPKEWDAKIMDYCFQHDPRLALICMLVYGSFLRPAEICRIKVGDIHLKKQAILVPAENAKNKHERWAILPKKTIQLIREMKITDCPANYYMISTGLMPGLVKKETRDLDKSWVKMRKALNMPDTFQLYSFRDTGIMDLKEQGVPDHLIIKLTGHLKMDMLEKYTHEPDLEALRLSISYVKPLGEREEIDFSEPSHYSSLK